MAMRWLTREWQTGGLPAPEREARWQTYLEHRDHTAIHLPPALHRLAATDVEGSLTLHRAVPEWWAVEDGKALTLGVITDDDGHAPEAGPQRLVLQYAGNLELGGASAADLDQWLGGADSRLLYDEIEVLPGRRFEQRFLLAPDGELTVRFDNVLLVSAPTTADERAAVVARKDAPAAASDAPVPQTGEEPTTAAVADDVASAAPEEQPEGSPSPVPAPSAAAKPRKRTLREALLSWLPGVRGPHA